MARIRTIKPEFCTSRDFHKLSDSAKCFFMLLLCFLDDEGRAEYLPKKLAGDIYPLDEDKDAKSIRALVKECVDATMLLTYEVDGKEYLCAPNFNKHQTINRPAKSRFPSPSGETPDALPDDAGETHEDSGGTHGGLTEDSLNAHGVTHGALTTMQVLEIGNRKEEIGKGNRKVNAHFVAPTFDEVKTYMLTRGKTEPTAGREAQKFLDYYDSIGWKVGRNSMKDWPASVRSWFNRQEDREAPKKEPKPIYAKDCEEAV